MGKWTQKLKREFTDPIPKFSALFLLIAGLFMGTVFTFGQWYREAPVTKEEAVRVEATFLSYKERFERRGKLKEMYLTFEDYGQQTLDGAYLRSEIANAVRAIKPGTPVQMYIHPRSSTILELSVNGRTILGFEQASEKLSAEVSGFTVLGILMYLFAAYGAIKLIRKEIC